MPVGLPPRGAALARQRYERGPSWLNKRLDKKNNDLLQGHCHQTDYDDDGLVLLHEYIEDVAQPYTERRNAEQELAEYMGVVGSYAATELKNFPLSDRLIIQATKHMQCRTEGRVLNNENIGKLVIAWDDKCGCSRFCPDESRAETQRLKKYYLKHLVRFYNDNPLHRIFYSVFTLHNFEPGQLAHGKKYLFKKFKQFTQNLKFYAQNPDRISTRDKDPSITYAGAFCPVICTPFGRIKTRKKDIVMPPDPIKFKGDLVIQEDPLSALGDWNVHLNVSRLHRRVD